MKLTADPYYYVYFCVFEEPAMFKPLSYSSEFVSIRQPFVLSTDNASFQAKNIRAGSPDLFMSMGFGTCGTLALQVFYTVHFSFQRLRVKRKLRKNWMI